MIQHYQQVAQHIYWHANCIDNASHFNDGEDGELITAHSPALLDLPDLRLSITEEKMSRAAVIAFDFDTPQLHPLNYHALISNNSASTQISPHDFETKRFKEKYFFLS